MRLKPLKNLAEHLRDGPPLAEICYLQYHYFFSDVLSE